MNSLFQVEKDSWKCEVCSVRNKGDVNKCAACETPRPGFEEEVSEKAAASGGTGGPSIGSGGFVFGGSSTAASGGIGSSGFTFGAPAPKVEEPKTTGSGSGFTFGGSSSGGFSFGGSSSTSDSAFTVGKQQTSVTTTTKVSPPVEELSAAGKRLQASSTIWISQNKVPSR